MTTDHDSADVFDLRELAESDAWFDAAASGALGPADPLGPAVGSMLGQLERELAALAPVDGATVTALLDAFQEGVREQAAASADTGEPAAERAARRPRRTPVQRLRRHLLVAGTATALVVAASGVAAAAPGSFLFPLHEVVFGGAAADGAAGVDLAMIEHQLDVVEVRIVEAQQAGGVADDVRGTIVRRLGVLHPIVEAVPGDAGDALRSRWQRDYLVVIALVSLDADGNPVPPPGTTGDPVTPPTAADPGPTAAPESPASPAASRPSSRPDSPGRSGTHPSGPSSAPRHEPSSSDRHSGSSDSSGPSRSGSGPTSEHSTPSAPTSSSGGEDGRHTATPAPSATSTATAPAPTTSAAPAPTTSSSPTPTPTSTGRPWGHHDHGGTDGHHD
ncbi:MAG: hypothetical protein GC157_13645 [Frankiales bacterium]|nr:hypothetical protein [Frankiales bacterium]